MPATAAAAAAVVVVVYSKQSRAVAAAGLMQANDGAQHAALAARHHRFLGYIRYDRVVTRQSVRDVCIAERPRHRTSAAVVVRTTVGVVVQSASIRCCHVTPAAVHVHCRRLLLANRFVYNAHKRRRRSICAATKFTVYARMNVFFYQQMTKQQSERNSVAVGL